VALSVGFRTVGHDFTIGSSATLGTGEALAPTRAAPFSEVGYRATDVRDMRIMVFVGGANHAVRQLVRSVFE
jgi:hypothetical protein